MRIPKLIPALVAASLAVAACAPDTATDTSTAGDDPAATDATDAADDAETQDDASAAASGETQIEDIDLEELIAAAQAEGSLNVLDNTSKVEKQAEAFAEAYGIEITATKADAAESVEILTREAQAGNVATDVAAIPDVPSIENELIAGGIAYSWLPADVAANMDDSMVSPAIVINDPSLFTYNTEAHGECPIDNMWAVTDEEWNGLFAFEDPVNKAGILDWWSQTDQFGNDELEAAYEEHYGEAFSSDEGRSATEEWVAGLAANDPILTGSSEEASEAIGAPGQENPPIGLLSSAKFRNIDELGYELGVCDLTPWAGMATPKGIVIAEGTKNPNAAKLWVHFMYTQEGIQAQIDDGKMSTNTAIEQPEDPADVATHAEHVFTFDGDGVVRDWEDRQQWSDLWRMNNA